jgi:hypothetical protein
MVIFMPPAALPHGKSPCTMWRGGWLSARAGLDAVVRRKIPSPYRDSNPCIIRPVAQRYTTELSRLLNTKYLPLKIKKVCSI